MKIAVMTDVHANLPALRAALDEIKDIGCDKIIHTGDLIALGPQPRECIELMFNTPDATFVMGNHDAQFASGLPQSCPISMTQEMYEHELWTHTQLDPTWREAFAQWPYAITKSCTGIRFAFMHYGWNAADQQFCDLLENPTPQDLDRMFGGKEHDLVFYGHSHVHSDQTGLARYINPGALGCFEEPVARFILIELLGNGKYEIEHRAAPYSARELLEAFESRQVPHREVLYEMFYAGLFQGV